jgi:hypothetical protein
LEDENEKYGGRNEKMLSMSFSSLSEWEDYIVFSSIYKKGYMIFIHEQEGIRSLSNLSMVVVGS